ncbi:MAG: rhomboid family intramembrane serine protease, partial [Proteobacteria bacterium]|nr:rhomboid family intramembrane serine protease [Pseudomonadota bacterium]
MGSSRSSVAASGAVSGVLGAYLLLHPKVKVLVLVIKAIPLRLPAYIVLGGWI